MAACIKTLPLGQTLWLADAQRIMMAAAMEKRTAMKLNGSA